MARTDYYAIPTTTLEATSQAIRDVNQTVGDIAPEDYPDLIGAMHSAADYSNVMDQLVEETASGSIASITDGSNNLPVKELVCSLTGDNSECKITKLGANWLKADSLTYARPSNIAFANTTKRTFTENSYCIGLTSNNYCQVTTYEPFISNVSIVNNTVQYETTQAGAYANIGIPTKALVPGQTYSWAATLTNVTNSRIPVSFYKEDGTFISYTNGTTPFTVPAETYWSVFFIISSTAGTVKAENIMINAGASATSYEPYITPTIYNIPFGQTVNGGELIIAEGEFDKIVTSDTPQETIVLPTKTQVKTLLGANNLYHDCNGNIEVEYRANGALYAAQH